MGCDGVHEVALLDLLLRPAFICRVGRIVVHSAAPLLQLRYVHIHVRDVG